MCTYQTERLDVSGSGKGSEGWFSLSCATFYFDHPTHYPAEHSLNIDFLNLDGGAREESRWNSTQPRHGSWHGRSWRLFRPRRSPDRRQ